MELCEARPEDSSIYFHVYVYIYIYVYLLCCDEQTIIYSNISGPNGPHEPNGPNGPRATAATTETTANKIPQPIQAPFSTHPGTTYPVRISPR